MSFVYLIQAQNGVVKIGCAQIPEQRLAAVKTHSPVPVRLIAVWPGDFAEERAFHKRFDACRSHLEWFRVEGELLAFIAEKQGVGLDRILGWHEITYLPDAAKKEAGVSRLRVLANERWADPAFRRKIMQDNYYRKLVSDCEKRQAAGDGRVTYAVVQAAKAQAEHRFTFHGPYLPNSCAVKKEYEKRRRQKQPSSLADDGAAV